MLPSVYINLEDDVARVVARVKKTKADALVLVCPRRCQLFSDSINLRLLKKQADLQKKQVFIMTMDERGQLFAKEAGFELKNLPKTHQGSAMSDIYLEPRHSQESAAEEPGGLTGTVKSVTNFVSGLVKRKREDGGYNVQPYVPEERLETKQARLKTPKIRKQNTQGKKAKTTPKIIVQEYEAETPKTLSGGLPEAKKSRRSSAAVSLATGFSLIVVLGLVFGVLPSGKVVIYPKSELVTRDFDISLDTTVKEFDSGRLLLPARLIDETVEASSKFKSQGKRDVGNKATGSVRVYNFTGQILNLRAETTSLSAGSKIYSLAQDALQIRPTRYKNEQTKEIDEASLSPAVEIIAASGGEDSNLPAGVRMEITNQVLGSRPQEVYAKSETPVSGGTSRFLSVVSPSDLAQAQAELGKLAVSSLEQKLSGEADALGFAENSYRVEVLEFFADKQEGAETPNFSASLKARVVGLAFSEEQLKNLAAERIGQGIPQSRYLKTGSGFNISYKIRSADLNAPVAVLAVHFEGKSVVKFEPGDLTSKLRGKNREQASEVLGSMADIEKAEITLSPSWQTTFPWFASKILIEVYD